MRIDIQARNFSPTDAMRNHAERRLRFALTCCDDYTPRAVMRLSDINGPRGGSDKRCHLRVVLTGLPDVVVEDTEGDLYVAIDRAADRARRTLVRKIERRQILLKQGWKKSVDKALYPGVEGEGYVPRNLKRLPDGLLQSVSECH